MADQAKGSLVNYIDKTNPDPVTIRSNDSVFEDYLSDQYFFKRIEPNRGVGLILGAAYINIGNIVSALALNNAATQVIGGTFRRRSFWSDGILRIPWFGYSSTVGGGNVVLQHDLFGYKETDTLDAFPPINSTFFPSLPVAATAYTFNSYTSAANSIIITPDINYIGWRVVRFGADAGDTNTGNMLFLGMLLEYIPRKISCSQK